MQLTTIGVEKKNKIVPGVLAKSPTKAISNLGLLGNLQLSLGY